MTDPISGQPAAAAGWYIDPTDATQQRWWNGVEWTETRAPAQVQTPPPYSATTPVTGAAYQSTLTITNGPATAGLVLGIIAFFVNPLTVLSILGIILSAVGLNKATQLASVGYGAIGRGKATWGLVLSILALLGTALFKGFVF
jgi:hypothetical protein